MRLIALPSTTFNNSYKSSVLGTFVHPNFRYSLYTVAVTIILVNLKLNIRGLEEVISRGCLIKTSVVRKKMEAACANKLSDVRFVTFWFKSAGTPVRCRKGCKNTPLNIYQLRKTAVRIFFPLSSCSKRKEDLDGRNHLLAESGEL